MSWISYLIGRFSGVHRWPVLGVPRGEYEKKNTERHGAPSKLKADTLQYQRHGAPEKSNSKCDEHNRRTKGVQIIPRSRRWDFVFSHVHSLHHPCESSNLLP